MNKKPKKKKLRQYDRTLIALNENRTTWMALHDLATWMYVRFNKKDSEAGISARIRDIRKDLEANGETIEGKKPKNKNAHVYKIKVLEA